MVWLRHSNGKLLKESTYCSFSVSTVKNDNYCLLPVIYVMMTYNYTYKGSMQTWNNGTKGKEIDARVYTWNYNGGSGASYQNGTNLTIVRNPSNKTQFDTYYWIKHPSLCFVEFKWTKPSFVNKIKEYQFFVYYSNYMKQINFTMSNTSIAQQNFVRKSLTLNNLGSSYVAVRSRYILKNGTVSYFSD